MIEGEVHLEEELVAEKTERAGENDKRTQGDKIRTRSDECEPSTEEPLNSTVDPVYMVMPEMEVEKSSELKSERKVSPRSR